MIKNTFLSVFVVLLAIPAASAMQLDQGTQLQANSSLQGYYIISNTYITLNSTIINYTNVSFIGLDLAFQGCRDTDTNEVLCAATANCFLNGTGAIRNITFGPEDVSPLNITFEPPTPNNETLSVNYFTINVSTNETATGCDVEGNFTGVFINESMTGSGTVWVLSKSGLANGTYYFRAWCTDVSGIVGRSSQDRYATVAYSPVAGITCNVTNVYMIDKRKSEDGVVYDVVCGSTRFILRK